MVASAILVRERKGALVMIRSVNEKRKKDWDIKEMPSSTAGFVEAQMIKGFMYVEHIDEDHCWFHGMININPNFSLIPDGLVNMIVKRVVYILIGKLENKEVFENELIIKRMSERTEFYDKIKARLREVMNTEN